MNAQAPSILDRFFKLLELLIAACLAVMVVMVFGNVVLRYAFNSGIAVSEELSRWLFVWLTFVGALIALKQGSHLGTDMLVSRLGRNGKRVCLAASQLLMMSVTLMLIKGSWTQAVINLEVEAPVTGAPMAVVYAAGLVFGVPALLLLLGQFWRTLSGQIDDDELVMVKESEDNFQLPSELGKPGVASTEPQR